MADTKIFSFYFFNLPLNGRLAGASIHMDAAEFFTYTGYHFGPEDGQIIFQVKPEDTPKVAGRFE